MSGFLVYIGSGLFPRSFSSSSSASRAARCQTCWLFALLTSWLLPAILLVRLFGRIFNQQLGEQEYGVDEPTTMCEGEEHELSFAQRHTADRPALQELRDEYFLQEPFSVARMSQRVTSGFLQSWSLARPEAVRSSEEKRLSSPAARLPSRFS